jgi:hypothetical protein
VRENVPRVVETAVYEEAAGYRNARVKQYIPVLVQHAAQERLLARLASSTPGPDLDGSSWSARPIE